jgi:hypothetical protein
MKIHLHSGLPCISVTLEHHGKSLTLDRVLIDTGSGGSIFSIEVLQDIDIQYEPEDRLYRIKGVGGTEFVFGKVIDSIQLGTHGVRQFQIEIGAMDYGFNINGIIGMDFLMAVGALIDLEQMELTVGASNCAD